MATPTRNLAMTTTLQGSMSDVEARVTDALKAEGFGILTEIDMQATFKQKLDVDYRPYKILGACNPPLAHQALEATGTAGLLLPCNVTLTEVTDGEIEVAIVDPNSMLQLIDSDQLQAVADTAREKLTRALANMA